MTKVLVFGTFDVLHKGHEFLFSEAKKHGDELYVIIALDSTVLQVKGKLPKNNEYKRLEVVSNNTLVKKAILGNIGDKLKIIEEINPDFICIGYDQNSFNENLENKLNKRGINPKIIKLESFQPDIYKSSKFI